MNSHLARAQLLLEQSRYDLAAQELRQEIARDPDDPVPHSLLALCLAERKEWVEATREAQLAVHLAPDLGYAHYVVGHVLFQQERLPAAEAAVNEAIRLDPEDADYFALLASIRLQRGQFAAALEAAESGLRIEAEHVGCNNLRAMALVRLGRKQEAGVTIDATLARDPENALTHANQGWTLLHRGDHQRALEHFREALRLEPEMEWARQGIVEALNARNIVYRLLLRYFLWMSRLGANVRWGIILGGYFGSRVLRGISRANPDLAPYLMPLVVLYGLFAFLTWTAEPLFNLLLRLDPFGRFALSRRQIIASNFVGGCVVLAIASGAVFLVARSAAAAFAGIAAALLMIPIAGTFATRPGTGSLVLGIYTGLLAVSAVLGVAATALFGEEAAYGVGGLFLLGVFLFTWIAAFFQNRQR